MKREINEAVEGMAASEKLTYLGGKMLSVTSLFAGKSKEFNKNLKELTLKCADGEACGIELERTWKNLMEVNYLMKVLEELHDLARSYSFELSTLQNMAGEQMKLIDKETGEIVD